MKLLAFFLKLVTTIAVGASALAVSVALLGPAARSIATTTTPLGNLDVTIKALAARSVVFDRYGNVIDALATEDRAPVKLRDVPKVLVDAVLSIEDRKFYEHNGVDWGGTTRALFKNVDAGGIAQGGSTITQQLVKNTLSLERERDLKTKAREAILAIRLENEMPKDEILENYLNLVYFGNRAYGVQAAAERYFNKPLAMLRLAEAALLAGLIQAPEALNPMKYPDRAARRRGEVLDAMVENAKTTAKAARAARRVPLPTRVWHPVSAQLDYYKDEVRHRLLIDDPAEPDDPAEALGSTQQERANAVFHGGLKIYTAYDPFVQLWANKAVSDILPKSQFTASLVAIDNADGSVRAIANGRTFAEMQFDPATDRPGRQPGSAFKVFTLAAALSRGYSPDDQVSTGALRWRIGPGTGKDSYYELAGAKDDCGGDTITLWRAIARSDNCAFMRTELSLGPARYGSDAVRIVVQTAAAMGVDTSNFYTDRVSTTLGTQEVRPIDMAEAYSVFANDGMLKRASFVTKIVGPDGKVLYQRPETGHRVLDVNVARTMVEMLKGPVRNGTASGTLGRFPRPAAGKTGTTDDHADAWFIGFTPQFTAAVWMGDPKGRTPMTNVGGIRVFGATYPARIWGQFMLDATSHLPVLDFTPPERALWPRPSYLDEFGRRLPRVTATPFVPPTSLPPGSVPPDTGGPAPVVTVPGP